jgi:hypothetical protein
MRLKPVPNPLNRGAGPPAAIAARPPSGAPAPRPRSGRNARSYTLEHASAPAGRRSDRPKRETDRSRCVSWCSPLWAPPPCSSRRPAVRRGAGSVRDGALRVPRRARRTALRAAAGARARPPRPLRQQASPVPPTAQPPSPLPRPPNQLRHPAGAKADAKHAKDAASAAPPADACKVQLKAWDQCGGKSNAHCPGPKCVATAWPGHCCPSGFKCVKNDDWYFNCQGAAPGGRGGGQQPQQQAPARAGKAPKPAPPVPARKGSGGECPRRGVGRVAGPWGAAAALLVCACRPAAAPCTHPSQTQPRAPQPNPTQPLTQPTRPPRPPAQVTTTTARCWA